MSIKPREFVDEDGSLLASLPKSVQQQLKGLDQRILPGDLEDLIVAMCRARPFRLGELAHLLNRSAVYLQNTALKRMLQADRLRFLYPTNPNHPRQSYLAGIEEPKATQQITRPAAVPIPECPRPSPLWSEPLSIGVND